MMKDSLLAKVAKLGQGRFCSLLRTISRWQPLTFRGALVVLFGTLAVRLFAIPEFDLVADILGKSALALTVIVIVSAFVARVRLAQRLKAEARFDTLGAISKRAVASSLILSGSDILPFFSLRVRRRFVHPGVSSPVHLVQGRSNDDGKRFLMDETVFPHRGLWELEAIDYRFGDNLGLVRFAWSTPIKSSVEVSAETLRIQALPIVASSARAGDEQTQSRERAGDMFDIKQYDPSDGIKRILWKTYAKAGQLVVRRPEPAVIPEGELALFLVAPREDDFVAGALQGYLNQLEESQISLLFATDGMDEASVQLGASLLTERSVIQRAINLSVWSESCGTGKGFSAFMSALESSQRMIRHIVVFGPERGDWLQDLSELASRSGIKLTAAVVPDAVNPEISLEEFSRARRREKTPSLVLALPTPLRSALGLVFPSFANLDRRFVPQRSQQFMRSAHGGTTELLIVQNSEIIF